MTLAPYAYTGELIQFRLNPFEIVPPDLCEVRHFCELISKPELAIDEDLCAYEGLDSSMMFDPTSGDFSFQTKDKFILPPGEYIFKISGSTGKRFASIELVVTMADPCYTEKIVLLPSPFQDTEYMLR